MPNPQPKATQAFILIAGAVGMIAGGILLFAAGGVKGWLYLGFGFALVLAGGIAYVRTARSRKARS